ncbi:MAG TPA: HAD family hydrolase [Gemmatimonadaceae bacterium]|nr:HAD family hydrolase [Gemmatimonadaceae bacterium]
MSDSGTPARSAVSLRTADRAAGGSLSTATRPAVFLDRDGTIIVDTGYVRDPDTVQLVSGAAGAIARLNAAGLPVIIVSNQSGIGRGILTEEMFARVQARVESLLAQEGAHVDATYICPHAPDAEPPCECRKPGTRLFTRAAEEHGIDLTRSWLVGDRYRDVAPAQALGARALLVPTWQTPTDDMLRAAATVRIASSLAAAVERILAAHGA